MRSGTPPTVIKKVNFCMIIHNESINDVLRSFLLLGLLFALLLAIITSMFSLLV